MGRLAPTMQGRWLTAAVLALLLVVAAIQVTNPHSYVSEAIARLGETGSGPDASVTDLNSIDQLQAA